MENMMPRGISKDLENFKETLEKGVILVGGEVVDNNSIDIDDDTPVSVAIVVDVTGYGPHPGAISAVQGHVDAALEVAHEILEEWTREHYPPADADADETLTETFDGIMWELPAEDFVAAIKGTAAEKYIDVVEYEEEDDEEEPEDEEPEDDDDDVFSDEEMEEGYVISDNRGGGYSVSHLGRYDDMDEALAAIEKDMKRSNHYPNIYYVNDHGNVDLLDASGNTIKSRV